MNQSSEKYIERKFCEGVKALGGMAIKLVAVNLIGLPDRLILLPKKVIFFVEFKSTGKKPTPIQLRVHERIRTLGFEVCVIDKIEQVNQILYAK